MNIGALYRCGIEIGAVYHFTRYGDFRVVSITDDGYDLESVETIALSSKESKKPKQGHNGPLKKGRGGKFQRWNRS